MSVTDPNKSDIASGVKSVANLLAARAEDLVKYAAMISEMPEDEFMRHLGDQYSGPGFMRQMLSTVTESFDHRPSDTYFFESALATVFGKAQREAAIEAAEVRADQIAREQAGA